MKTWILILSASVVGLALGVGIAIARVERFPWSGRPEGWKAPAPQVRRDGPMPRVEVDQPVFDFGVMDASATGRHEFKLTNTGDAPLTLQTGDTSCSCTLSDLKKDSLLPNESTTVAVEWKSKGGAGGYRQTATITTNDPDRSMVTLTVKGRIVRAVQTSAPEIVFSRISGYEPHTASLKVYGFLPPPDTLEITRVELAEPQFADLYDIAVEPMPAEQAKKMEQDALVGFDLRVTVKPGLPSGAFRQTIVIHTNQKEATKLEIPVRGTIASDITIVARGWDEKEGLLTIGRVDSKAGVERTVLLVVRGAGEKGIKFKPVEVSPDILKVEVGPTTSAKEGVSHTPLKIMIPPGTRPANHLGSEQGKVGTIELETNHPSVHQVRILVRFAVEG